MYAIRSYYARVARPAQLLEARHLRGTHGGVVHLEQRARARELSAAASSATVSDR